MLEGVVTSLLNGYLGAFLDGVDSKQLSLKVWSGELLLENVSIKKTALDFLHLPIRVKYGKLKKLNLSASWRKLSNKPVKIEMNGLELIAEPTPLQKQNSGDKKGENEEDRKKLLEQKLNEKLARLQAMEDLR